MQSRVYLSLDHQKRLFGDAHQMQVMRPRGHMQGQFVYGETLRVFGNGDASLNVQIYGPAWEKSHVELTRKDAKLLEIDAPRRAAGDLKSSSSCVLQGPAGVVEIIGGVICPQPSLYCSPEEAESLSVKNGDEVRLCLANNPRSVCKDVIVRVHPTYSLIAHVSPDDADACWLSHNATAQLIFS